MDIKELIKSLEVVEVSSASLEDLQRLHDALECLQDSVESQITIIYNAYRYIPAVTQIDGEIQLFDDVFGVNRRPYTPSTDTSKCWYCDLYVDALQIAKNFLNRYNYSDATACVVIVPVNS